MPCARLSWKERVACCTSSFSFAASMMSSSQRSGSKKHSPGGCSPARASAAAVHRAVSADATRARSRSAVNEAPHAARRRRRRRSTSRERALTRRRAGHEDVRGARPGTRVASARMHLRYALLALLGEGEAHGYQLLKLFNERVGPFWHPNIGQVYQLLHELERRGLAARRDVESGTRLRRV